MEPAAAACVPCNFQLANWTMAPAAWSPGFAAEPAESGGIYGGSWIQTCVPNDSGGGRQLVEYHAHAAATPQHYPIEEEAQAEPCEVVLRNMEIYIPIRELFQEAVYKFEDDIDSVTMKIHRYPPSIRVLDVDDWYTVPRVVAIGPYHRGLQQLQTAEQVKCVVAYHCITVSRCWSSPRLQEMYDKVAFAADQARQHGLYDQDVMAGISPDEFRLMMFFDACFLVQFMLWYTDVKDEETHRSLCSFFNSHRSDIHHDVWLLENQIPWSVVEAVMEFRRVDLAKFVAPWRYLLQDHQALKQKPFVLDGKDTYRRPHLLGILRHHIVAVGSRKHTQQQQRPNDKVKSLSFSNSAIELAQIGISITANKTGELTDMGLIMKKVLFAELSLAPLTLDHTRANRLVNMAAFELCTIPNFTKSFMEEDSAVCSYLLLLSMLVHREEDVHELRRQGVLQGGVGLTNKQALDFFTSFQSLPKGVRFIHTMIEIQRYRDNRKTRTEVYSFWYKNKTTILKVVSAFGAFVTLFGTLLTISAKIKSLKPAP